MKMIKKVLKGISAFFSKNINGTKGVISLFLALLMVPFATIAGALINTARLNSAVALFDEALCNASNSTLGTYDKFLRERFGLLALSQNYSGKGSNYTAEQFVAELFLYYMEQNMSVVSNTYETTDISADGIYPLADTDVLLTQVLEHSKYTVPAKMLVDGFNLEDILKKMTENLDVVSAVFGTIGSGADLAASLDKCQDDMDTALEKIKEFETARQNYEDAYEEFNSAVNSYNSLVDEAIREIDKKENKLEEAQNELTTCEETLEQEAQKEDVAAVLEQIAAIEKEKAEEKKTAEEAAEAIKKIEDDNKTVLKSYNEAKKAVEDAQKKEGEAQRNLNNTRSTYNTKLANKRATVTSEKSEYASSINALAKAAEATGKAVDTAQSSIAAAINGMVDFAGEVMGTVGTVRENAADKQIKDIKEYKQEAIERGDNVAAYLWDDEKQAVEDNKTKLGNKDKLVDGTKCAIKDGVSSLERFSSEKYYEQFHTIYQNLNGLYTKVQGYVIHNDTTSKLAKASDYYISGIVAPVSAETVKELLKEMANHAKDSVLRAFVDAIKSFIEAMTNISLSHNPNLVSVIDPSKYDNIGGLPSKKDRTQPQYSLESEYAAKDSQKSNYYKQLLDGYSSEDKLDGSIDSFGIAMEKMREDLNTISTCMEEIAWHNFFSKLKEIWNAVKDMFTQIATIMADIARLVSGSGIYEKSLLSGYLAYNLSSRTTYSKSALTGKSYKSVLPDTDNKNQGYAFSGAEIEYLLNGSYSEIENQQSVFDTIFFIRLLMNIPFVFMNPEAQSLAAQAGAATMGIGTFVVYVLYIFAEPMLDAIIIVNGSKVPIIKTKLYLTPSGIENLVKAFVNMDLDSEKKNDAYAAVAETMCGDPEYAQSYADAVSAFGTSEDLADKITFDYTKTLMLLMLFKSSETLLLRLSDIVQMECTFNAINEQYATYTFDLDKSYTYIRASGTFTATPFIRISEASDLTTSERIVYRGY